MGVGVRVGEEEGVGAQTWLAQPVTHILILHSITPIKLHANS